MWSERQRPEELLHSVQTEVVDMNVGNAGKK